MPEADLRPGLLGAWGFGFRPGRSAHDAVRQLQGYIEAGYRYCVDLDLEKFFDRVCHDVLMARLACKVSDRGLLKLIGRYLRAGVMVEGTVHPTREGVPQGGPLSPLLSNIVLDELDKELERRGHCFARYADDVVILVKSRRAGERGMASITRFLERKLKLKVNRQKSRVVKAKEAQGFLVSFSGGGRFAGRSDPSSASRRACASSQAAPGARRMRYRLRELGRFIRGWMGYFALPDYYRPLPEIDRRIRRRVRMCYWKQWSRPRRRIGMLLRLGVNRREAITTGRSSLGPHAMARTPVTQQAMSNQWLKAQGLISARDLWIALNYRR